MCNEEIKEIRKAKDEINNVKLPVIKKGFVFVPVSFICVCLCVRVCVYASVCCAKEKSLNPLWPHETLNP